MLPKARIICWDIETTNLKPDFGHLLCIGYKFIGEKRVHILSVDQFKGRNFRAKEKALVKAFAEVVEGADISVTHNGQRFDHTYMNAKMLEYRLGALKPIPQVDTLMIARKHLRSLSRKSLQNISYYLGTSDEKTPVEGRIWVDAMTGSKKALKYIIDHCKADVLVLEEVYLTLRPLLQGHPRVQGYGPCRYCGSYDLWRKGYAFTSNRGPQIYLKCQTCGCGEKRPFADASVFPEGPAPRSRRKARK